MKRPDLSQRNRKHGLCFGPDGKKTRLYGIWVRMRQRCRDANCDDYKDYGGRGIKVCEAWDDYAAFHSWAMENGYNDGMSIDRQDVNGDYSPDNCRWITIQEQARNKRNSNKITYRGETKVLREWARIIGIEPSLLRYRIKHWGIEKTFEVGNRRTK